ncbi:MAG: FAD-binding protein [Phycisphaerae bacterium]|nr:FAD-binding protein [Phycisphaerae bacterium]
MRLPVLPPQPVPPVADSAAPDRAAIADRLRKRIRGQVRFGRHDRMLYATDASIYQVEPVGVVVPHDAADAVAAVIECADLRAPILPRGGGTSLAGQCTSHAVVIDVSAGLRAIHDLALPDGPGRPGSVEAQAGVTPDGLNAELTRLNAGVFFAPDPATTAQATIGGCIGNNAAGARSVLYGRTSENVLAIDAVLADGRRVRFEAGAGRRDPVARRLAQQVIDVVAAHERLIRERYPRTLRQNAGYGLDRILRQLDAGATADTLDLAQLLCGSEGTLALTLGARLLLRPVPRAKGLALLAFDSVDAAIDAVIPILATTPSAVELVDDVVIEAARGNIECSRYVDAFPRPPGAGDPAAVLYVEYHAASAEELRARLDRLSAAVGSRLPVRHVLDAPGMADAWKLRKAGEPLLHNLPGRRKPITFVEDNAVPPERLAEFVREFRDIVRREGTRAAFWAHASVGVLHVRPLLDPHDPADQQRLLRIAVEVADLAKRCGGVMSGEHGDGRVRGPLLERFYGPELLRAFAQVKLAFDPRALLNPGNIVAPGPIPSILDRTRTEPQRGAPPPPPAAPRQPDTRTFFDYEDQHGFDGAVERCNGAGVCRKTSGGAMCPSYRATLDERHSTRGRGNALRLAITGQLAASRAGGGQSGGASPWADPGAIETLDLCLSCKACKAECPSNVDIARLKAEYTAQRFRAAGRIPPRALAIGHVRWINRFGAATWWLANAVNALPPVRWLLNAALGIHPRRSLPRFSRSLFALTRRRPASPSVAGPRIVLFGDCFTPYTESRIGLAAVRLLERLGYTVEVADAGCCARSMISVGMLESAVETADRTIDRLRAAVESPDVAAILVLEPSCLSAIKDDWLQLRLAAPITLRRRLADKAMLVEEFIDRRWDRHPRPPALRAAPADATAVAGLASSGGDHAPAPVPACILHAHCHQKALWGASSSAAALRRVLGDRLRVPDTGCCGMAGSFGYDARKFDLSMAIGNLPDGGILPLARAAAPDTLIAAPGTSCRHQIADGAGREALHPVEILERFIR